MTDSISLTIPLTLDALNRAEDMLHGMALDIQNGGVPPEVVQDEAPSTAAPIETPVPVAAIETPVPVAAIETPSNGVELDADGLPWDVRIHSKNKSILAKTKQWKKKRGVDAALVATVEAELRATMMASPAAPIETPAPVAATPEPTPAPVADTVFYMVDGAKFTGEQLASSGWTEGQIAQCPIYVPETPAPVATVTFPELMGKITSAITAKTLVDTDVTAALNTQGLASLPLLAARPDLIPAVYAALFE